METIKVTKSCAPISSNIIKIRKYRLNAPILIAVKKYNTDFEKIIVEEDEQ